MKKIIIIFTILILIMIIYIIGSVNSLFIKRYVKGCAEENCSDEVEEIIFENSINGNGIFIYKTKKEPQIEIHSAFQYKKDSFIDDGTSRIYKFYFDKWDNEEKEKFVVVENYEDYKYKYQTKKDYFLNYYTYIEVNDYDELIAATKLIIQFREYMGRSNVIINSYIKVDNEMFLPNNVGSQSSEEIMQNAIREYLQIVKKWKK